MVSSFSERFRRAILSDDLITARLIAKRALLETCNDAQPFDIRNQTVLRSNNQHPSSSSSDHSHCDTSQNTNDGKSGKGNSCNDGRLHVTSHSELLPALSATQHNYARQHRGKDRNRHAGRCKSSLTLAIEVDASIELIQWLLDMGHEREGYSRDARNCTMISLAAQHNRVDVIDILCTEAVANTASVHHQKSIEHDYYERMQQHQHHQHHQHRQSHAHGDLLDEDDEDYADHNNSASDSIDGSTLRSISARAARESGAHHSEELLPEIPRRSTSQGKSAPRVSLESMGGVEEERHEHEHEHENENENENEEDDDDARLSREIHQLLNSPDDLGRTALALASMKGYRDVVDKLLEVGSNINLPDFEGNTPLHYASAYNHILIVQLLIEKGCSYTIKNLFGFTAADYAYTSSLKGALEAFARTKNDRTRKQGQNLANDSNTNQKEMQVIPKTKQKSNVNPTKSMHQSTQHRLANQLRELHF